MQAPHESTPIPPQFPNSEEEMPYVENRDPLYMYPYIEAVMQAECAPVLRGMSNLIEFAPDMHIKASSRLEDDSLYYLSREGIYRRHWSALATAVIRGKDFDRDRAYYVNEAYTTLIKNGYEDPQKVICELASQPELPIGQALSATIPRFSDLDNRVKVTLGNKILQTRILQYADTASPIRPDTIVIDDPDMRTQRIVTAPLLPRRNLAMAPTGQLKSFVNDPTIDRNSLTYTGRILKQFGLQLPLKTTAQYETLTFEGFVRENFQKLAEGFEAGIDLSERSRLVQEEVQKIMAQKPSIAYTAAIMPNVNDFSETRSDSFPDETAGKILNYLLIEAMIKKGNTSSPTHA